MAGIFGRGAGGHESHRGGARSPFKAPARPFICRHGAVGLNPLTGGRPDPSPRVPPPCPAGAAGRRPDLCLTRPAVGVTLWRCRSAGSGPPAKRPHVARGCRVPPRALNPTGHEEFRMRSSSWLGVGFGLALILAHAPAARSAREPPHGPVPSASAWSRAPPADTAAPPESLSFLRFISICPAAAATRAHLPPGQHHVNLAARCPAPAIRSEDRSVVAALCVDRPLTRLGARARRRWWLLPAHLHAGPIRGPADHHAAAYQGFYSLNVAVIQVSCTELGAPAAVAAPVLPRSRSPPATSVAHAMSDRRVGPQRDPWRVPTPTVGPAPRPGSSSDRSNVAARGAAGRLRAASNVLKITNLEAVGAGAGMRLTWIRPTRVRGS